MKKELLLRKLQAFDPEIFALLQDEIQRQRYMLSLVPNNNAMSPFAHYLEGSLLANSAFDALNPHSGSTDLEELAIKRAKKLFNSEHAIVRLGNISAASRVVCLALLEPKSRVLSFNLRKSEHCQGLNFTFKNFGIDAKKQVLDWDEVERTAQETKPHLIIFSPVSYPRNANYRRLSEIARNVGAYLWVDIGQSVGLVAAGLLPSPVPFADVVTFPTNDSLHGPDGAIVLSTKEISRKLDEAVINTGHTSLHINHMAALAAALLEAGTETFRQYGKQVLANSKELEHALEKDAIPLLCDGTDTHLVLPLLPADLQEIDITEYMGKAGFQVKADRVPTMQKDQYLPALRLSSLTPTIRSLKEKEIADIGALLSTALKKKLPDTDLESIRNRIATLVMNKPIFSEEWLTSSKMGTHAVYNSANSSAAHEAASTEKKNIIKNFFHLKN